ncbi:hypothetical protein NKOR_06915 [Candidatus Nitrosopumilus koreensis AR1]|uniref:Cyclophilin TM1367-like domain-containing protein n=1 Tax=Candidatus Nitrosopumilus koreensis AR1 TaxID=1229908 RepID=K0B6Y2_9ARCH|nr:MULTISPECIES: cyclophilin-like fold protein [Nitrosopumilus]AFS81254.1 hypothetical protein NKOR_06915 [Candidatus Nitrosopumilus koreensis AR1]
MKHTIHVDIESSKIILELDDSNSPKTVNEFVEKLQFTVDLNVWGDEIYSSNSPINQPEENAQSPVQLNDVAYWPTGKAICLFYGSTPIGNPGEITPASPVNIIGKIISPDKSILDVADGTRATFRRA